MDREKFIETMLKPDAPDEMAFVIHNDDPNPDHSFSMEGIEGITSQMHDYILSRVSGMWRKTGKAPKEMRVILKIDWIAPAEEWLEQGPRPWFAVQDPGKTPMDGETRAAGVEGVKKMGRQ